MKSNLKDENNNLKLKQPIVNKYLMSSLPQIYWRFIWRFHNIIYGDSRIVVHLSTTIDGIANVFSK